MGHGGIPRNLGQQKLFGKEGKSVAVLKKTTKMWHRNEKECSKSPGNHETFAGG